MQKSEACCYRRRGKACSRQMPARGVARRLSPCAAASPKLAEEAPKAGLDTIPDEQEVFETRVGVVEPVEEDEAEVTPFILHA